MSAFIRVALTDRMLELGFAVEGPAGETDTAKPRGRRPRKKG